MHTIFLIVEYHNFEKFIAFSVNGRSYIFIYFLMQWEKETAVNVKNRIPTLDASAAF